MSEEHSFVIPRPEDYQPSGVCDFSNIYGGSKMRRWGSHVNRDKNKFYFDDFFNDDDVEYKRKYQNDWSELREYVGLNDIELTDNELVIVNKTGLTKQHESEMKKYSNSYNILRVMAGMGGIIYPNVLEEWYRM